MSGGRCEAHDNWHAHCEACCREEIQDLRAEIETLRDQGAEAFDATVKAFDAQAEELREVTASRDEARSGLITFGKLIDLLERQLAGDESAEEVLERIIAQREEYEAALNAHAGIVEETRIELEEKVERARDWTLRVVMRRGVELGMMGYADELIAEAKSLTFAQLTAEWGGPTPKLATAAKARRSP